MRLFAVARIVSALPCKTSLWTSWLIASKGSSRKSVLTHTQACRKQFLRLLSTIDDIRGLHVGSMYSTSLFIVAANSCACVLSLSQQHLAGATKHARYPYPKMQLKHCVAQGAKVSPTQQYNRVPSACQKKYRQALNECKNSVKADKRAYWKAKAVALEADFAAKRVHAAYKSVGLRDELDRVQSLSAGKLRRSDGSHTANRKRQTSENSTSKSS